MSTKLIQLSEFIILFIAMPCVLLLPIIPIAKLLILLSGVIYCLYLIFKQGVVPKSELSYFKIDGQFGPILLRFICAAMLSTVLMYFWRPTHFFIVLSNNFPLWLGIIFFYSIFSALPQELIYRSFFYHRYQTLIKNPKMLLLVNALAFSFAHIVFQNYAIFLLTFIGALLFSYTYKSTESLLITALEHALYGNWLFTLGLGDFLGFPPP